MSAATQKEGKEIKSATNTNTNEHKKEPPPASDSASLSALNASPRADSALIIRREPLVLESKVKLRPIIQFIYATIKTMLSPILGKLSLIRDPKKLPKIVKQQRGGFYLTIKKPGDILLAATIIRIKRVALLFNWGECDDPRKVASCTRCVVSNSDAIQLYAQAGKTKYTKICEVVEKASKETSEKVIAEKLEQILNGKADKKATKDLLKLSLIAGVSEAVRDPTMLVFLFMALNNIKYDVLTFKQMLGGEENAYPPTQAGKSISQTLNSLNDAKDEKEVYRLLELKQNYLLKQQIKRQIVKYLDQRKDEKIGIEFKKFSTHETKNLKEKLKLHVESKNWMSEQQLKDVANNTAVGIIRERILQNLIIPDSDAEYSDTDIKEEKEFARKQLIELSKA